MLFKNKAMLVMVCVLLMILTACGNSSSTGKSPENQETTIQFWTISLKPTFDDYINGMIASYEEENPGVKIVWEDYPGDVIQNKLITSIAGKTAPDVVNLHTNLVGVMAGKGALVNMEDSATQEQRDIYIETLYNSNKVNNGVYGFPWYVAPNIGIINKELFDKAGLSAPPKNYDEMFGMAKTMKEKTGAYLMIPTKIPEIFTFNGIEILNEDKTKAVFNTPEAEALLQRFADGIKDGYIYPTDWNVWDKMIQNFATSKIAMLNAGANSVKRIHDESPEVYKQITITPPMLGSSGTVAGNVQSLVVLKGSKHVDESIKFANYITNDKNQLEFAKLVAIFPTVKKAAADPFFQSDLESVEGQATAMSAQSLSVSIDLTLGTDKGPEIINELNNISSAIAASGKTPKQALDEAETKVNDILAGKK